VLVAYLVECLFERPLWLGVCTRTARPLLGTTAWFCFTQTEDIDRLAVCLEGVHAVCVAARYPSDPSNEEEKADPPTPGGDTDNSAAPASTTAAAEQSDLR